MDQLYTVKPFDKRSVNRRMTLPGSKSISNRVLLLAALARGETVFHNFLISDDTIFMAEGLNMLGYRVEVDRARHSCAVRGGKLPRGDHRLFVGNAGTAMRFLASFLCLGDGDFYLDGDERMHQRPVADLIAALRELDCDVMSEKNDGCPPLIIRARGIEGTECHIRGENSSQYISSLLMAAPYSKNGMTIRTTGEVSSRPYIDMTLRIMEAFGVNAERRDYSEFRVKPAHYKAQKDFTIEPDASSASYFFAGAAMLTGKVEISGLGARSVQGDTHFVEVLQKMGCGVIIRDDAIVLQSDGRMNGIDIDMNEEPDMVPTLAIASLFADGPTRIRNVANLRIKESDRIAALTNELRKLGADVKEYADGLEIHPKPVYHGARIATYNDHRIAMAFALAGLRIPGVEIENPGCVSKSFPEFFHYLEKFSHHHE